MQQSETRRATAAAMSIAAALGLAADDAVILQNSNRIALRLLPSDVLARVAPAGHGAAAFEVELARRLADANCPVGALEPRVEPRAYERDGFTITFWTYYPPLGLPEVASGEYAISLAQLHAGMREIDVAAPHFTDRVAEAQQLVASREQTPALADDDRAFLGATLQGLQQAIIDRGAAEQLLHGEPHPGNVLNTASGPLFIDLETCCRGPIEFDLAHVPEAVSERYPGVDQALLGECRILALAMIATWRWDRDDQLPNGLQLGTEMLGQIRALMAT